MKRIIKIGIQDNDYPIWLEGEITTHQLELLIRLLQTMLDNRNKLKEDIKQALKSGKPEPVWKGNLNERKNKMISKIISKLTYEEMEYLRERKIITQADIICELLKRIRNKENEINK